MKALLISLLAVFTLAACHPRDPEVLSKEEKSGGQNRSQDNKGGNSCDPKLSKKLELAMGSLAEARLLQAEQTLNLGIKLSNQKEEIVDEGCLRSTLLEASEKQKKFRLSYRACKLQKGDLTTSLSGVAEMIVVGQGDQVTEVEFDSRPLDEENPEALVIQIKTKASKDRLYLSEQINLKLNKEANAYKVHGDSFTELEIGFESNRSTARVKVTTMAELTQEGRKNWSAEVRGTAENVTDACTKLPSQFELYLDPASADSKDSKYFIALWNDVEKSGQLTFTDSEIQSKTTDKKSQKEDKASAKKNKIETATDIPPWEMWL